MAGSVQCSLRVVGEEYFYRTRVLFFIGTYIPVKILSEVSSKLDTLTHKKGRYLLGFDISLAARILCMSLSRICSCNSELIR